MKRMNHPLKSGKNIYITLILIFSLCTSIDLRSQETEEVNFQHEGLTLFGTFLKPEGEGPFPTLIIGPGSGAIDRDATLLITGPNAQCLYPDIYGSTLKPYKQLAEALADSGFAVLRYDKPEYTYPSNLGTVTFAKLWLPIESAIDYVKTRSDVDTANITLIGHSESSYLIPYIAMNRSDVKNLISLAGPRAPFDSLLTHQIVSFAEMCNGDLETANAQANQILAYYALIRSGNFSGSTPPLFGVPAAVWSDYLEVIDVVDENYNSANLPTLFIGLDEDINVPPIELERFQNDVTVPPADFWSIPGLNHYMTPMDDPDISVALTDTIIYWLRQFSTPTSIADARISKTGLTAYPNPFDDVLFMEVDNYSPGIYEIRIIDDLGREVRKKEKYSSDNSWRLDNLGNISPGIYTLEFSNGKERVSIRIVKR